MRKITEHTDGGHIYMKLQLDDGRVEEIDVCWPDGTMKYKTTQDTEPARRDEIIAAFNVLY